MSKRMRQRSTTEREREREGERERERERERENREINEPAIGRLGRRRAIRYRVLMHAPLWRARTALSQQWTDRRE